MTYGATSDPRDRSARAGRPGRGGAAPTPGTTPWDAPDADHTGREWLRSTGDDPQPWPERRVTRDAEATGWPDADPESRAPTTVKGRDVPSGWPEPPPITPGRRRVPDRPPLPTGRSWRTYLLGGTLVLLVLASLAGALVRSGLLEKTSGQRAGAPVTPSAGASAPPSASTSTPTPSGQRAPVDPGKGTFVAAQSEGPVLGGAGALRRFHVEVEDGIGENVDEFATAVDKILGDPRSWTASGQLRLQRVPKAAPSEFTIFLASATTSEKMCAVGGLHTDRFTSCRLTGQVIINDARWLTAIPDYGAPLDVYRAYAVNHEVGHELGQGHEACTGAGQLAPVMQQQTLGLKGCVANSWPFVDGRRYIGPEVP